MEAQGVAFPYLMIQMYRSGEASGSMDKTALIMADQYTKDYEIKQKREIEDQKIKLAKEQMSHESKLQKQKDDAAMEREQLKARTALKNKVAGEK